MKHLLAIFVIVLLTACAARPQDPGSTSVPAQQDPGSTSAQNYHRGFEAYIVGDYETALNEWILLARQGKRFTDKPVVASRAGCPGAAIKENEQRRAVLCVIRYIKIELMARSAIIGKVGDNLVAVGRYQRVHHIKAGTARQKASIPIIESRRPGTVRNLNA